MTYIIRLRKKKIYVSIRIKKKKIKKKKNITALRQMVFGKVGKKKCYGLQ